MKRVLSIVLSSLLLLSSTGFLYSAHYCFGRKVNSGLTQSKNAKTCWMTKSTGCETQSSFQNKSCCDNEFVSIDTDTNYQGLAVELDLCQNLFLTLFTYTYLQTSSSVSSQTKFRDSSPPPIVKSDFQAFHQVYII